MSYEVQVTGERVGLGARRAQPGSRLEAAAASGEAAWHQMSVADALCRLNSDAEYGLDDATASARLAESGPNELVENGAKPWHRMLWEQVTSVMVLILIGAAGLSLALGKWIEALSILAIVALFAILGFVQEYRAEQAIAALKKMAVPNVRVLRGGALRELSGRALVPGDVVALETGSIVPADARVIAGANLRVQEAMLTGESEAVEKTVDSLPEGDLALGDRRNMVYMGTQVTYGRGVALIVETGLQTELGRIATLIQGVEAEATPLQTRLDRLGKQLALVGALVAVLVLVIGIASGESLFDMLVTAISVAVAVIPEGLPAVVTFTLAVGAQRMLRRNALIRKLPAVETLGSVTVVCSDKTGTLTENRMTVTVVDVAGHRLNLLETYRHGAPALAPADIHGELLPEQPPEVRLLLSSGALCNDARIQQDPEGRVHTIGDPTEGALLIAAAQMGLSKRELERESPRVAELPFDSDRKRMTTIHCAPNNGALSMPVAIRADYLAITKGSVDGLLDVTTRYLENGAVRPLDGAARARIEGANHSMAQDGMRVLGFAVRPLDAPAPEGAESNQTFIGLMGMIDPPRAEVRDAVAKAREAGIRPVMITGDHPLTASAIARDLGIPSSGRVVTGADLSHMSDADLGLIVEETSVFARVSPEHKLRIVDALQRNGHIAAMTGDGVNDAPALRSANIGVAMGITGTDVSKEAADMVLRDDNFATIVAAVEEGRVIYDNLRRFVKFAVAGNLGKIMVMVLWPLPFLLTGTPLSDPVALLPLQLLWLNLLTDGLLGLSMGAEPAEPNVMRRPPHSPKDGLFAGGMGVQVLWTGLLIGALTLAIGLWYYLMRLPEWQTMMFATLASLQVFQALATRSNTESVFALGLFSNRLLLGTIGAVVLLQLAALYLPVLSDTFLQVTFLTWFDVAVAVGAGLLLFAIIELEKAVRRRHHGAGVAETGVQG